MHVYFFYDNKTNNNDCRHKSVYYLPATIAGPKVGVATGDEEN